MLGWESSCQCIPRSSWGLRSHWRIQNFNSGGPHGERGARAYNGGLGAEPPAGSRGRAPGQVYHDVLTDLLDRHCPTVKVRRRAKQNTPWFDADCRVARRRARAAERRFRRSRSDADRRAWSEKLKAMRTLYEEKNCSHWRNEIAASNVDTRRHWRTFKDVLGDGSTAESDAHTANDFAAFFKDKVEAVRASTAATQLYDVPWRSTPTFAEWSTVTSEEVEKLIGSALNKTCQLDPAPTWLVKDMRGLLSPFISTLFNKSLSTGCFPQDFKEAVVRPLLKKSGL